MPNWALANNSHAPSSDKKTRNPNQPHPPGRQHESCPSIQRQALLVANGEIPVPADLSANDLQTLVTNVQTIRRRRLLDYAARAIATDIYEARAAQKGKDHAQAKIRSPSAASGG
jgi:hypothetical protein